MPPSRISARVIGFIADKIDTVAELETLLILSDDELRSWSAQDLAARLYIEPAKAATILNTLVRRRLVIVACRR
jgi:DNA-binding MarR family transcriptional regulator